MPLLSVIVPLYNEASTAEEVLAALVAKQVPGVDMEIVLIESNSTDGTREIVRSYEGKPGVRVIWEERPQGKGHAVRAGLAAARGDIF